MNKWCLRIHLKHRGRQQQSLAGRGCKCGNLHGKEGVEGIVYAVPAFGLNQVNRSRRGKHAAKLVFQISLARRVVIFNVLQTMIQRLLASEDEAYLSF